MYDAASHGFWLELAGDCVKATVSVIARCWIVETRLNRFIRPQRPLTYWHLEIWRVEKGGQRVSERLTSGEHCLTVGQHVRAAFNRCAEGESAENDSIFALDIDVSERMGMSSPSLPLVPHKSAYHRKRTTDGSGLTPVRYETQEDKRLHFEKLQKAHTAPHRRVVYKIKYGTMHEVQKDGWRPRSAGVYPPGFRSALRCLLILAKGCAAP